MVITGCVDRYVVRDERRQYIVDVLVFDNRPTEIERVALKDIEQRPHIPLRDAINGSLEWVAAVTALQAKGVLS